MADSYDDHPKAENIKVVVRIRPMQKHEAGDTTCIRASVDTNEVHIKLDKNSDVIDNYSCSRCFTRDTSQEGFFRDCDITTLLDSALGGYRSCAFAFGQTGAGKTYTMLGPPDTRSDGQGNDGLLGRSLVYIFEKLKARNVKFVVKLSCLEVYHEHVYDLFSKEARTESSTFGSSKAASLQIREHTDFGYYAEGCHIVSCPTLEDALSALEQAMKNRQIGGHDLNSRSNRSHCITDIYIDTSDSAEANKNIIKGVIDGTQRENLKHIKSMHGTKYELADKAFPEADVSEKLIAESSSMSQSFLLCGRMTLVDLAGSERLKSTNSLGTKMINEAGFINRSLYVLGKVITGLAKTKMKEGNAFDSFSNINPRDVPFRESKLTKLLLGGILGGLCMMVCCVSECTKSVYESKRTLMFGMSCARIKSRPTKLLDPQIRLILDLKDEVQRLRQENIALREASKATIIDSTFDESAAPIRRPLSAGFGKVSNDMHAQHGSHAVAIQYSKSSKDINSKNIGGSSSSGSKVSQHNKQSPRASEGSDVHNHKSNSNHGHASAHRISPRGNITKLSSIKDQKRNIVLENKRRVDPFLVPPKATEMRSERGLPLIPLKLSKQYADSEEVKIDSTKDRDSFDYNDGSASNYTKASSQATSCKSIVKAKRSVITDSRLSLLNRQLQKLEAMEKERERKAVRVIEAVVVDKKVIPADQSPVKSINSYTDDCDDDDDITAASHATDTMAKKKLKKQQVMEAIITSQTKQSRLADSPFISHLINPPKENKLKANAPKKKKSSKKDVERIEGKLKHIEAAVSKAETLMEDDPAHATAENEEIVAAFKVAIKETKDQLIEVKAAASSAHAKGGKSSASSAKLNHNGDDYDDDQFDNEYGDDDFEPDEGHMAAKSNHNNSHSNNSNGNKTNSDKPSGHDHHSRLDYDNNISAGKNGLLEDDDDDEDDDATKQAFRDQLLAKYGNNKNNVDTTTGTAALQMHKPPNAHPTRQPNSKIVSSSPIKPMHMDDKKAAAIEVEREARQAKDKAEADKKRVALDAERLAKETKDKERLAKIEADKIANIEASRIEKERLAKVEAIRIEKIEADRIAKLEKAEHVKKQTLQDDEDGDYGDYDNDFEDDNDGDGDGDANSNADPYKIDVYSINLASNNYLKAVAEAARIEGERKMAAEENARLNLQADLEERAAKEEEEKERLRLDAEKTAKERLLIEMKRKEALEADNQRKAAEEEAERRRQREEALEADIRRKAALEAQEELKRKEAEAEAAKGMTAIPPSGHQNHNHPHSSHNHHHHHNHPQQHGSSGSGIENKQNNLQDDEYGEDEFYDDDFDD